MNCMENYLITTEKMKFSKRSFFKGVLGTGLAAVAKPTMALSSHAATHTLKTNPDHLRISFGSCNLHYEDQSFWNRIAAKRPDYFFFIGDNIYANTRDMKMMAKQYRYLKNNAHYKKFVTNIRHEAIWDDHDMGEDGANRTYPHKDESQRLFLDFFNIPEDDPRRRQKGIYHTKEYSDGRIKVYFLDCRYYRDEKKGRKQTLLGEKQFQWLEDEMSKSKAQVNIIVSSIGVLLNRMFVTEDWAEFPADKERLMNLIARYDLSGAFFLSGDKHFGASIHRHWGRNGDRVKYYELQSSGFTHTPRHNLHGIIKILYGFKNVVVEKNFATMDFDFSKGAPRMQWTIQSLETKRVVRRRFCLERNGLWKML